MKKFIYILVALVFTASNALSFPLSETTSDPTSSAFLTLEQTHAQQFAGVHWLPDYLGDNTSYDKHTNEGGKVPTNPCEGLTNYPAPYGCQKPYKACPSKCQVPNGNNCSSRTAVSIPSNASCNMNFSDCSSKCESWSCNSGYIKSGNVCIDACQYSVTAASCTGNCQRLGADSCTTQAGNTYYASCGSSTCSSGQSCSGGRCVDDCVYSTTREYCTSQCRGVSTSSCTRGGTTYYASCDSSTCGSEQRCSSGICVNNCTYNQTAATCNDQCKDVGTTTCTRDGTTYYSACGVTRGSKDCTGNILGCKIGMQTLVSSCKDCSGTTLNTCRNLTCVEQGFNLIADIAKPNCGFNCTGEYYYNGTLIGTRPGDEPLIKPDIPSIGGGTVIDKELISGDKLAPGDKFLKATELPNISKKFANRASEMFAKFAELFAIRSANALIVVDKQPDDFVFGCENGLCVVPEKPITPECPFGYVMVGGKCVRESVITPEQPFEPACISGQTLVNGKCVELVVAAKIVKYNFVVSSTCSSNSSYLKGEWVK